MSESNKVFYDRISRAYDLIADASEHRARERGEELLGVRAGEQVLEVGFGTGNTLIALAKAVGPEGRVVGIDISEGMRDVAQEKIEEADLSDRVRLVVGDARDLPFSEDRFDTAFLSFTLELFSEQDMAKVLGELRRVLKEKGRLGVVSMAEVEPGEKESLLERGYEWMHRHFPHIVDCRPIDVKKVLESADFEVQEEDRLEMWTMPVTAAVAVAR